MFQGILSDVDLVHILSTIILVTDFSYDFVQDLYIRLVNMLIG